MVTKDVDGRSKSWKQKGIALIPFAVGLPLAAGIGLYVYVLSTMTPLHPSAQDVASIKHANPLQRWTGAVEQARQVVRADLTEQNLPGVSVAVGIGGDGIGGEIVWAEGFGWADLEKRAPVSPEPFSQSAPLPPPSPQPPLACCWSKAG